MKIKLSPFAEQDINETKEFYNLQKDGLGDKFTNEINEIFNRIKENPNQFPKIYKQMRSAQVNHFPFGTFFIIEQSNAYILDKFHSSRNPKTMKKRFKSTS